MIMYHVFIAPRLYHILQSDMFFSTASQLQLLLAFFFQLIFGVDCAPCDHLWQNQWLFERALYSTNTPHSSPLPPEKYMGKN